MVEAKIDCGNDEVVYAQFPASASDEFVAYASQMSDEHNLAVRVTLTSERRGVIFDAAKLPGSDWVNVAQEVN